MSNEREETKYIIVHASDTQPSQDLNVEDIKAQDRKDGWLSCRFHKVITRDGDIQDGRDIKIAGAHIENSKKVFIAGRSLNRAIEAANEVGYRVEGIEKSFKNLENFSHDNSVIIAGGSQGETRSTMTRIANSQHEQIKLKPGDTAIFSSSKIPGNELAIERVHNVLLKNGIKVITDEDELVHVSGHPGKDDIVKLYNLIKPQISIPVHGTSRHLKAVSYTHLTLPTNREV